jgi:hypothetical protein
MKTLNTIPSIDMLFWQQIVEAVERVPEIFLSPDYACMLEQLLCQGSLPIACADCGHKLSAHQFDIKDPPDGFSFCDCCPCKVFAGPFVER